MSLKRYAYDGEYGHFYDVEGGGWCKAEDVAKLEALLRHCHREHGHSESCPAWMSGKAEDCRCMTTYEREAIEEALDEEIEES